MGSAYPRGQEAVNQLTAAITDETDRGKALMAGAFLDAELELLLRSVTVQDKGVANDFFRASGVLGTFASRIDAVYLLGLISKAERRDLHLIRKIRNDFGHTATPLDFDSPRIRSRCLELHHHLCPPEWPVSERFMHAAMHVVGVIHGQILDAKAPIPRPDEEGYSEERQAEFFRQAALEMQRDLGAGSYRAPADRLPTSVEKEPGRNDHVTIMNPSTGEEETLKYKHALSKLNSGWMLVSV